MSRPSLAVAVVGLGVGEQHAAAFSRHEDCVLRLVYDLDPDRAATVLTKLGAGSVAESFQSILADKNVAVVSIASYDDCHFAEVMAALGAGKHVFVEKPLCRSTRELRAIKHAWVESGHLRLASNLVLRGAPLYIRLRECIRNGDLGEIYAFDAEYLYGRIEKITEGWRSKVEDYSVMQGGGVHMVDLMLWLTGQTPSSVSAVGNRICTEGTDFAYHDYVAATFSFDSGLIGRITANFGCVHRHQHVVRVFGTKGTFLFDDQGPRLHTSRSPSQRAVPVRLDPLPPTKGALIPDFVTSILDGQDHRRETQHEFNVLACCIAADRALSVQTRVEIEYP